MQFPEPSQPPLERSVGGWDSELRTEAWLFQQEEPACLEDRAGARLPQPGCGRLTSASSSPRSTFPGTTACKANSGWDLPDSNSLQMSGVGTPF